ncbi:hypothetical protein CK219_14595 [Mesorhizobium sp. WSM4313]|nr:hypothetical protein CK219_14595 [Mesorhizobium sp. WSM4313]
MRDKFRVMIEKGRQVIGRQVAAERDAARDELLVQVSRLHGTACQPQNFAGGVDRCLPHGVGLPTAAGCPTFIVCTGTRRRRRWRGRCLAIVNGKEAAGFMQLDKPRVRIRLQRSFEVGNLILQGGLKVHGMGAFVG